MYSGMMIGTTSSQVSLLPELKKVTPSGRGEAASQVPENADFYLSATNLLIVQVESISGYLDCILEFGESACPLVLTTGLWRLAQHV